MNMLSKVRDIARRIRTRPLHRPDQRVPYRVLGSDYGAWPLIQSRVAEGAVVYSFGVGEDVSFDLAAIEQFGVVVHGFDPTPKSMAWVARQSLPASYHFHPIGIAAQDGEVEFVAPVNPAHVSYSKSGGGHPENTTLGQVRRLETVMHDLGHRHIDVLKMDIEGFEYEVIPSIISGSVRPDLVLIEFHHGMYGFENSDTNKAVQSLTDAGYGIFYVSSSGREYGFVRKDEV